MLAELGSFSLILALVMSLIAASALYIPMARTLIAPASSLACLLIFTAFIILMLLRVESDFSVINVAEHSNLTLPLLYKIAGTWGNHEGSMLLWALVVSGFGAWFAKTQRLAACIQSMLLFGVLLFILTTSNPFWRMFPPAADGKMLNPLLQDMALAIHPPLLYLGYVGFSAVFSLAIAGLLVGRIDRTWAGIAHPIIMFSWATLTGGIALGSWWAYRELGWGGFWFWDPVENASLLPWFSATALLHANIVLKKRGALVGWVALLSLLTFGLSLIGTFLVRSGVITSVHSFASDPARGLFILAYIATVMSAGLWIYATRIQQLPRGEIINLASRGGLIVVNNLFLLVACATVLLGTLYPLIAESLYGERVSVGAPYFNRTILPLMVVPLIFAALSPTINWQQVSFARSIYKHWPAAICAVVAVIMVLALVDQASLLAAGGFALAAFLMAASGQWLMHGQWRKRAHWPVFLGHSGMALLVAGITGAGLLSDEVEGFASAGDTVTIAGYEVEYQRETLVLRKNYAASRAIIVLRNEGELVANLTPEYRHYHIRNTTTSEAAIYSTPAYDIYAVIGELNGEGKRAWRLYFKPTISFLWGGTAMMVVAGIIAIFNRRRRT